MCAGEAVDGDIMDEGDDDEEGMPCEMCAAWDTPLRGAPGVADDEKEAGLDADLGRTLPAPPLVLLFFEKEFRW